jgi:hypothetical protein
MFYSVIDLEGKVIAECFTREAAYNAYRDALKNGVHFCKIEATGGQPVELVRACRQKRAATAYVKSTIGDYRRKPEPMTIVRGDYKYVVPKEMIKQSGELKKNALDAINRYFASLSKKGAIQT